MNCFRHYNSYKKFILFNFVKILILNKFSIINKCLQMVYKLNMCLPLNLKNELNDKTNKMNKDKRRQIINT